MTTSHDRVLPFYENLGISAGAVLTAASPSHPYELLLAGQVVKHRTTKVRSPAPTASSSG